VPARESSIIKIDEKKLHLKHSRWEQIILYSEVNQWKEIVGYMPFLYKQCIYVKRKGREV